jgi:hypothetical protein
MYLFCGGMPRSGSTLQYQLVSAVVESANMGQRWGWKPPGALATAIRGKTQDKYVVIKSHVPIQEIIDHVKAGTGLAFYIYRDLRDVVVSTMNKHDIGFRDVWSSSTIDDAIGWGKAWESLPGVFVSRYEKLITDMKSEIKRIANHIKIECPDDMVARIAAQHAVKQQHKRIDAITDNDLYHPTELLHKGHIGKANGKPGQWRDRLNIGEIELVEHRYKNWQVQHGYQLVDKIEGN